MPPKKRASESDESARKRVEPEQDPIPEIHCDQLFASEFDRLLLELNRAPNSYFFLKPRELMTKCIRPYVVKQIPPPPPPPPVGYMYLYEKHPAHCAYRATELQRWCDGDECRVIFRGTRHAMSVEHNLEWFNVSKRGSRVGSYQWCRNCDHKRFLLVREMSRQGSEKAWKEANAAVTLNDL